MTYVKATLVILFFLVRCLLAAAVEGLMFFAVAALVSGALAWLLGSATPRDFALTAGGVFALLAVVVNFTLNLTRGYFKIRAAWTKELVDHALKELDEKP